MPGKFISFEGGEGSGKSTQLRLLAQAFEKAGMPFLQTREPGGSPGGEQLRALLVGSDAHDWNPVAETLIFYAARLDHVRTLIQPALAKGKTVLCDRFADSTRVYQGIGKDLGEEYIDMLHRLTLGNIMPDLTVILDIDPAAGLKRAHARCGHENRFEALPLEFHQRIRAGFLSIAAREPGRCAVIDAAPDAECVHAAVIQVIRERLGLALPSMPVPRHASA